MIYIDHVRYDKKGAYCYLFTDDDISRLHDLADTIRVTPEHFIDDGVYSRYRVNLSRRVQALDYGCRMLNTDQSYQYFKKLMGNELPHHRWWNVETNSYIPKNKQQKNLTFEY